MLQNIGFFGITKMGLLQNHRKTCILLKRHLRKNLGVTLGINKLKNATKHRIFQDLLRCPLAKPPGKCVFCYSTLRPDLRADPGKQTAPRSGDDWGNDSSATLRLRLRTPNKNPFKPYNVLISTFYILLWFKRFEMDLSIISKFSFIIQCRAPNNRPPPGL